ncbi:MAG: tetratricopeptide repeat protein [Elusimicrobia bacterium]|nr:tetratricopeptide repeat protein [Elusimicrobiota bacterium]
MLIVEISLEDGEIFFGVFDRNDVEYSPVRRHLRCGFHAKDLNLLCCRFPFFSSTRGLYIPGEDGTRDMISSGRLLWKSIFPSQVREVLSGSVRKTLLMLLDDRLAEVPWELAYDGSDFLCRKFACSRILRYRGEKDSVRRQRPLFPARALVLADPAGGLSYAYAEGLEIKGILSRLPGISVDFRSFPAGKMFLHEALGRYDMLHFAGHCLPGEKGGWVLSDGIFGAEDVAQAAQVSVLPSFVFANACASAAGRRGFPPLAGSFLLHGTMHYLGTIAAAEDAACRDFAAGFYRRLRGGLSIAEIVRLCRYSQPSRIGTWSRYVLYGRPDTALYERRRASAAGSRLLRNWKTTAAALMAGAVFLFGPPAQEEESNYLLLLKGRRMFRGGERAAAAAVFRDVVNKTPRCVAAYRFLGEIYEQAGRRREALECYYELARQCAENGYQSGLSCAYSGIGWIYQMQGKHARAAGFYSKSLALARENHDRLNEALALRRMAVWQIDAGDYDAALGLLTKSSDINREKQWIYRHKYNLACDYFDIGLVFVNKDDYPAAKKFYLKSKRIFERLGAGEELSDCYFNLGEVFLLEKDYARALEFYLKGLELDIKQRNYANIAGDHNMIGELYLETGDRVSAERSFMTAEANAVKAGAVPELAEACCHLASICKSARRKQEAREYLRKAQAVLREIDMPAFYSLRKKFRELEL